MAEAIHCPSCSTRYRLRPERLRPSYRRAQCFTCHGIFPIGDVVQRLLAPAEPEPAPAPEPAAGLPEFEPGLPEFEPGLPEPEAFEPPSLTLMDLEGADAEILDKTLVETLADLPEAKPAPAASLMPPPELEPEPLVETTSGGFTSARDAIEKLFGGAPAEPGDARATRPPSSSMDVEATLSALEHTLGGTTPTPQAPLPELPPEPAPAAPTAGLASPSSSTVRFTREEVMAAMRELNAPAPPPEAHAEATVALRAGDLALPERSPEQAAASAATLAGGPLPTPPPSPAQAPEGELLRLKIGEEVYPSLTMAQITQWVEEGRVLENHLVARQFSENWLEAHKVPNLRPVFDRLRRERLGVQTPSAPVDLPPPPTEGITPQKKGLFGGLFGGKN